MKPKIKRILIPTDFSTTGHLAVKHAAFMAKLLKADLCLLHVIEINNSAFEIYNTGILPKDDSGMKESVLENLNHIAYNIGKEYSIGVKTICKTGSVTAEIARAVQETEIDIVIMGTHGAHGFKEFFLGSNAYKTVNICSCPVITIQTGAKRLGFSTIVLPLDNCFESRQKAEFTIALAKEYAAKIYILGLTENISETEQKKFRIKLNSVEKATKKAGVSFVTKILNSEDFALDTLHFAKKVKADLISVLTDHESNYDGKFLGVFAQKMVNHSKIPILSLHPVDLGVYDSVSLAGSNSI